jgi:molybdenum cofactor cytidylyltransferase
LVPPLRKIAAIILAAGLSSRFKAGSEETKLVLPLFGKPLVRHVAEAALASHARPILVITGHAADQVKTALKNLDLSFISNPDYRTGLASSLKAGIVALPETTVGVVVLLADMPCISVDLIDHLIYAFENSQRTPIAVRSKSTLIQRRPSGVCVPGGRSWIPSHLGLGVKVARPFALAPNIF